MKCPSYPPEIVEEDGNPEGQLGEKITSTVRCPQIAPRDVIVIAHLLVPLLIRIWVDEPLADVARDCALEAHLVAVRHHHPRWVHHERFDILGELENLLEEALDTVLPNQLPVVVIELGHDADHLPPDGAGDLLFVVESFVAAYRVRLSSGANERLEVGVNHEGRAVCEAKTTTISYI